MDMPPGPTGTQSVERATADAAGSSENADLVAGRAAQRAAQAKDLAERASRGETLSKGERKRLNKFEHEDERKENRKREKQRRKLVRDAQVSAQGPATGFPLATPAVRDGPPLSHLPAAARHARAWEFWRRIGSPTRILAPMVNQSELAFRLLARRHGAQLTYTPMLNSTQFAMSQTYRQDNFDAHAEDRPLVVQFCGDDPATLIAAARMVEGKCDAIELNCGCPQAIARRGHYGAFLLDEPDLIVSIVEQLTRSVSTPVMVKMRVVKPRAEGQAGAGLPGSGGDSGADECAGEGDGRGRAAADSTVTAAAGTAADGEALDAAAAGQSEGGGTSFETLDAATADAADAEAALAADEEARFYQSTMRLALRLQAAGAAVLTLHGRTKEQKTKVECDWKAIATLKRVLSIPVVANGGVENFEDLSRCLAATGADGVMSSEAALENPAVFREAPLTRVGQAQLAREYVELARRHPPRCSSIVKAHLFKLLYMALEVNSDLRVKLGSANNAEATCDVAEEVLAREAEEEARSPVEMRARCDVSDAPVATWYRRHRFVGNGMVRDGDGPALEATQFEP